MGGGSIKKPTQKRSINFTRYTFMEYLGLLHERSSDEGRKAETAGSSGTGRIPVFREIHAERRKADGK